MQEMDLTRRIGESCNERLLLNKRHGGDFRTTDSRTQTTDKSVHAYPESVCLQSVLCRLP